MPVKQSHYEMLLAEYSDRATAITLLRKYRPYLEMLPSLRRPEESLITLPLPIVRLRSKTMRHEGEYARTTLSMPTAARLPCDLAILMCDPEWKVKMGVEIAIFIHRPQEDFSDLLRRWRQTQVALHQDYEWLMPPRYQHILSDGADQVYPLFVIFNETPERIRRGLAGACLPFVIQTPTFVEEETTTEAMFTET